VARSSHGSGHEYQPKRWTTADAPLTAVRIARRRYWAARESGEPAEIERALSEWVDAQIAAADFELETRGWVVEERPLGGQVRPSFDEDR
jgi:hypothetical protein